MRPCYQPRFTKVSKEKLFSQVSDLTNDYVLFSQAYSDKLKES